MITGIDYGVDICADANTSNQDLLVLLGPSCVFSIVPAQTRNVEAALIVSQKIKCEQFRVVPNNVVILRDQ